MREESLSLEAAQVQQELGEAIDLILADGPCPGGLPSTILNVVQDPPRLVRAGAIGVAALERADREAGRMRSGPEDGAGMS